MMSVMAWQLRSERYRVAALEREHVARLPGRGDLQRQVLEDGADARHLVGIGLRQLPLADEERILEPDADIAAHDRAHGDERQLMPAGGGDRRSEEHTSELQSRVELVCRLL